MELEAFKSKRKEGKQCFSFLNCSPNLLAEYAYVLAVGVSEIFLFFSSFSGRIPPLFHSQSCILFRSFSVCFKT